MSLALAFWICFLLWLVLGVGLADRSRPYWYGYPLLLTLLVGLLGWAVFGAPLHH
jgi:hypothetical protein